MYIYMYIYIALPLFLVHFKIEKVNMGQLLVGAHATLIIMINLVHVCLQPQVY